ncbi:DedA family protein [Parvibium lacunae]|uniref:DedA family protein n=1 Tax=Parvibium lacunae TaxID=1888893 RepID=A0A368L241_9BURK|nr:DedA family protein [Parvibium lacunae]RCS57607.1 DedA family protein [Parvibium lacunae]
MDIILSLVDFILHLDKHLDALIAQYGIWIYGILFAIVFLETGLVIFPFLPGDSLLFVAGAFAARGEMDLFTLMALLIIAAITGDALNYAIGRRVGPQVFRWEQSRWFNKAAFDKAHAFYERHGGKTIVIARFVPFIRTFAPFVAGVAQMSYRQFAFFNITGALLWVISLCVAGYLFGNVPLIKNNLTVVIFSIIGLSLLPLVIEFVRAKFKRPR